MSIKGLLFSRLKVGNPSLEIKHPTYSYSPTAAGGDGVLLGPPDVDDTPPEFDDIPDSGLTVMVTTIVSVVRMVDRAGQFVTVVGGYNSIASKYIYKPLN